MEQASRRLSHIASTLGSESISTPSMVPVGTAASNKSDDDVVIVAAVRTALTKAKRGGFKDTHPTDLLAAVLKAVVDKTKIDPKLVGDINVGNVLLPGGGATQARMAMFLAGYPDTVPISTVNRQCSSGLQAFSNIASQIQNGTIDVGIAAGFESMSLVDMTASVGDINPKIFENDKAKECLLPMGETSENVAAQYHISREKQDQMAFDSFQKALRAQKEGRFNNEIVPVKTVVKTPEGEKEVVIDKDDGVRPTTLEQLKKLRPAFRENGTSTAGNSSQTTDGAAAVLAMKRRTAKKLGLPILGRYVSYAVAGVPPAIMGVGPAFAIPAALEKAGLKVSDIDIYEINEAFASQATYCIEKLGIPYEKLNPNGGGIALGHPLGCTGARQIATLMNELKRTNKRFGVVSMCIGTGMGAAGVFEAEN